jgi:hypothetical protein
MEVMVKNAKILTLIVVMVAASMPATVVKAEPDFQPVDAEERIDINIDVTPVEGDLDPVDAEPTPVNPDIDFTPADPQRPVDGDIEIQPNGPDIDANPGRPVDPADEPEIRPEGPTIDITPVDGRPFDPADAEPRPDTPVIDITPVDGRLDPIDAQPTPTDDDNTPTTPEDEDGGSGGGRSGQRRNVPTTNNPGQVLGVEKFIFLNNLKMTMNTADVMELQKRLRAEGYFTFPTDTGYFGPITMEAVKKYQAAHPNDIGYVTGYVGPLTRGMLNK